MVNISNKTFQLYYNISELVTFVVIPFVIQLRYLHGEHVLNYCKKCRTFYLQPPLISDFSIICSARNLNLNVTALCRINLFFTISLRFCSGIKLWLYTNKIHLMKIYICGKGSLSPVQAPNIKY